MNSFWNKGEKDIIQGLDVLGLRGIDQHIETQLLASITTISIRARYLSMISWIVGEFFDFYKDKTEQDSFAYHTFSFFTKSCHERDWGVIAFSLESNENLL